MNPDDSSEKDNTKSANAGMSDVNPPASGAAPAATTASDAKAPAGPDKPKGDDSKRKMGMVLILIAVMLLLVGGAVALNAIKSNDTSKTTTEVVQKKDVSVLRLGTTESGYNVFPPTYPKAIANNMVDRQVFEPLVAFNGTKIVPSLAVSWTNPDDSTWVFKTKQNVKFHTGKLFTATDAKASIEAASKQKEYKIFTDTIKSIEVVDANTLKITTTTPDAILLSKLTFIFMFDGSSGKTNDPVNGTGPYIQKPGSTVSGTEIQLVAFDDYHGGHVYTRELSIKNFKDAAAVVEAIKNGTIDFATSLSADNVATIKATLPNISSGSFETTGVTSLYFNVLKTGSPLQKKEVRQALYLAIDPEAVIKASGNPSKVASQIVPPTVPGFDPTFTRPTQSITKSKELLKAAGYETGLTVTFSATNASKAMAEEIKKQLEAVGVTVNLTIQDTADKLFNDLYTGGKDLIIAAYTSDINDLSDVASVVYTKTGGYLIYDNATVNELLKKAGTTFDPAARLKVLQQISRTIADDFGSIPLRVRVSNYAVNLPVVLSLDYSNGNLPGVFAWKIYQK